jgi:hypothetical protein
MPPYQYDTYRSPYGNSIAELIARRGQIAARQAEQIANAQARATEQSGNAWAGAIQNIGQTVAQLPQQIQQARRAGTIDQMNALRLQQEQRQMAGQQAVAGMMRGDQLPAGDVGPRQESFLGTDGLFDVQKITHALGQSGYGDMAHELVKGAQSINESILEHQKLQQQVAQAHTVLIGDLAAGALQLSKAGTPLLQAMDFVVQPALATKRIDAREYAQVRGQIEALPPDQQTQALGALMDQAAKLGGNKTLAQGAQEVDRYGRVIAKGGEKAPTETELALRAAKGDPDAIAAMNRLKPAPNRTAEQDDQRYRDLVAKARLGQPVSPEDAAWAKGYEQQKTLGIDKSAAAAADRQAAAIAQQTTQQKRAQDFAEAQVGRKELTDKVEAPYRQAQQSAQELRDLVTLAQAGNKEAASLQSLQATMSLVRANGLNRLNQAEMKLPAEAGSLWDKVQGRIGKLVAGQPIDADLQKDLLQLADFIEKGAYNRYATGHKDVSTRYGLKEAPASPPTAAPEQRPIPGIPGGMAELRNGKWIRVK